jgi:hypothetical protein
MPEFRKLEMTPFELNEFKRSKAAFRAKDAIVPDEDDDRDPLPERIGRVASDEFFVARLQNDSWAVVQTYHSADGTERMEVKSESRELLLALSQMLILMERADRAAELQNGNYQ